MRHEQAVTMTAAGDCGYFTNGHVPKAGGIGQAGNQWNHWNGVDLWRTKRPLWKQNRKNVRGKSPRSRRQSTAFFLGDAEATPFTESNRKVSSCYFYTDQLTPLDYPEMLNYSKYLFKSHLTSKEFSLEFSQRRVPGVMSIVWDNLSDISV